MKRQFRFLAPLVIVALMAGCASSKVSQQPGGLDAGEAAKTAKIEPEARNLYFQAERAFSARNFDEARRLFQQVKSKHPRGRAAMMSSYRLGMIYYYQEEYPSASREFEAFLSRYPKSDLAFDVNYNLAASEYQQGKYERAGVVLNRLRPSEVNSQGPRRAEVVYQLQAQNAAALGNHAAAVTAYSLQMQLPLEEGKRSALADNIDGHLAKLTSVTELERLQTEISEPVTRARISQRLSALRSVGPGELPVTPERPSVAAPSVGESAQPLHSRAGSAERTHVGVLLPLSGKNAVYGKRALEGILLAAGFYFRSPATELKLFIEDTASNAAQAQQAVDKLVNQDRVMAIIGPLHWRESVAVAERAQQLGVANVTLTGKEGISEKGAYLFQNALTPRVQLESLVSHCVKNKGFRRFAILAPANAYGKDMANEFWGLVEAYGGRIVAYQTYAPEEKDFQAPIRDIIGLSNPKFRKLESAKLAEYIREQKAKTGKEPRSQLPAIADFDALFVPDSPKNAAAIAASLTYFDVTGIPLLGTTEWNSDALYKRGGRYVEGAMFPGGVSLNTKNPRQREFIRLFTDSYGNSPDLLASQAFEAMEVVAVALKRSSSDRNDLVSQLAALKDYEGPLGTITFDSTRIAKRSMPVFTLDTGGNIVEQ